MTFELTQTTLDQISHHFHIGKVSSPPVFVPGGKLHQVWKLSIDENNYALKRLEISTSSSLVGLYRETQKIAEKFQQNNIPVITALQSSGDPVCVLKNYYFMIFDWIEGEKISPQNITCDHAAKMGFVLSQMHQLNLTSASFDTSMLNEEFYDHSFSKKQWQDLVVRAVSMKISHADILENTLPLIIKVCDQAEQTTQTLKSHRIISHRDASPNNVIWQNRHSPIVIDWELAGLIHPTVDLLGGAFDWSVVKSNEVSIKKFKAFISAYLEGGGHLENITDAFYALMGIWLSWMEFNLKRFIDHKTSAEKRLGEREAIHTLLAFHCVYSEREKWLAMPYTVN